MTTMKFMVMSAEQAAELREASVGADYALNPRMVDAGDQAGRYVLLSKLKTNPDYEAYWPELAEMEEMDLDTDVMWPPEPEEDEE